MSSTTITLTPSEKSTTERRRALEQQAKRKREASAKIEMLNELAELRALFGDDIGVHSLSMFR